MVLLLYVVVAVLTVFLDLFTKYLVKNSEFLVNGGTKDLIPHVLRLRYVENPGAAFGSLSDNRWVFLIFSVVAIVILSVVIVKKRKTMSRWVGVAFSLVVGGGIGNMYERLFNMNPFGKLVVTDFLDFYLIPFWKWVFNLADAAVCVGAGILIVYYVRDAWKEWQKEKAEKADALTEGAGTLTESVDGIAVTGESTEGTDAAETAEEVFSEDGDELLSLDEMDPDEETEEELARLDGASESDFSDGSDGSLEGASVIPSGEEGSTDGLTNSSTDDTTDDSTGGQTALREERADAAKQAEE